VSQRRLVIDESLAKRLATELRKRGRDAVSVSHLQLGGYKDPELLPALVDRMQAVPFVLVTGDDAMPEAHADVIEELSLSVATVDPRWEAHGWEVQEAWKRETVHRWAHRMAEHSLAELRRYSPTGHRLWRPLRR
jgi:hypothetical protein